MTRRAIPLIGLSLAWMLLAAMPPAVAQDQARVTITRSDCQRLVRHVPAPDVAYQPGVDVNGRPVAPADLGSGVRIKVPEVIEIPIDVDLQDRFGIPPNRELFKADAFIGSVVVTVKDGRAYFNGQPLQDEAEFALTQRCQEILSDRR